jgi:hypothetical protein
VVAVEEHLSIKFTLRDKMPVPAVLVAVATAERALVPPLDLQTLVVEVVVPGMMAMQMFTVIQVLVVLVSSFFVIQIREQFQTLVVV